MGILLTSFYAFRMWILIFLGEPRGFPRRPEEVSAYGDARRFDLANNLSPVNWAHESEPIMTRPLIILAFCCIFSGWTFQLGVPVGPPPVLERMLEYGEPYRSIDVRPIYYFALGVSILISFLGIALALFYYAPADFPFFPSNRLSSWRTAERFDGVYRFLVHKWYFDDLYMLIVMQPLLFASRLLKEIDQLIIDEVQKFMSTIITVVSGTKILKALELKLLFILRFMNVGCSEDE